MSSPKQVYLGNESPDTDPSNVATVYPQSGVGAEFGAAPVAQVRVWQKGENMALLDTEVVMAAMIETSAEQMVGLDAGLGMLHGPQVPDSSLAPLRRTVAQRAGGRNLTFTVADRAQKNPVDELSYLAVIVVEYLQRCPQLDDLNMPDVARRVYNDALAANLPILEVDIADYVNNEHYSVLDDQRKTYFL